MSADAEYPLGEYPPSFGERGRGAGQRFAAEFFPQHRGSAVPAILDGADRAAAHKTAVDEIRKLADEYQTVGALIYPTDLLAILTKHGIDTP